MLKHCEYEVVFDEVPDEITLAINISGCPIKCEDCHSKHLWEDIGIELFQDHLFTLIDQNQGISCIAFMGGDGDVSYLTSMAEWIRKRYPSLRIAWFSGRDELPSVRLLGALDYLKIGPYKARYGPLNSKATNQRMYRVTVFENGSITLKDITHKFWK